MGQLIFSLLLALVAGVGVTVLIAAAKARQGKPEAGSAILPGVAVFLAIVVIFAVLNSYTIVQAGSVAVVKRLGEVVAVFEPGLNWKIPFIDQTINYRTQDIVYETSATPENSQADYTDYDVDTATSDGQQITASYTVRFRIKPQEAANIVNTLGTEVEVVEKIVKQSSRVWVRTLLRNFEANQLYSGDILEAQDVIAAQLKEDFEEEGLDLVFFGLRQVGFSEAYKTAVELKQIEAENIITKQNLARQAEFTKERTITEAEGEAEKQKLERIGIAQGEAESITLRAKADADATLLRAKAQAEANQLIAKSLTADVINWQAVSQWNGRYPTVVSSGGGEQLILPGDLFNNAETP